MGVPLGKVGEAELPKLSLIIGCYLIATVDLRLRQINGMLYYSFILSQFPRCVVHQCCSEG